MLKIIKEKFIGSLKLSIVQNLKNGYYLCQVQQDILATVFSLTEAEMWLKDMKTKIQLATKVKQKRASRKPKVTLIHS